MEAWIKTLTDKQTGKQMDSILNDIFALSMGSKTHGHIYKTGSRIYFLL